MRSIVITFSLLLFDNCQTQQATFRNPILDESVLFPSIYKYRDSYYLTLSNGTGTIIEAIKSPILSNFRNAERREIFRAPQGWVDVGGPRMHYLQDNLYIYFYMRLATSSSPEGFRMFVIRCLDPLNPLGNWSDPTRLLPEEETVARKPTILRNNNGDLYILWTGAISGGAYYNIFIAKLETPLKAIAPRTLLRNPTMDWEMHGAVANEAPSILHSHGAIFLVFSASSSNDQNYCLGIMGMDGGEDPMQQSNWWNDVAHCIFARNDVESVWGTGHSSFVMSPDESETWMVYQAWNNSSTRTIRIQKLDWEEMNRPKFPSAMGFNTDLNVPSGE